MFRTSLATAIALAVFLPSSPVHAQDASDADALDRVVVTGTRTAVTVDDSLAPVEVIDRAEIERAQARSLADLLRGRAGVNLVNQGGLGKLTTVFMRGTESDHTLFLVDGVRVGSSTSGLTSIQDLPVEMIDRIEIVRGPRSSLYGSEAIGGVIQVFTRHPQSGVRTRFKLGGGSHNLREASAGLDVGFDRAWFGADYAHQSSDGFQSCTGAVSPVFAGCFMENPDPDNDGYENNSVSLRAGIKPVDALTLDANVLRAEGRNEYDAEPAFGLPDLSRTLQQVVGGKAKYELARSTWTLSAGRNVDRSVQSRDNDPLGSFESKRDGASLQGDIRVAEGHLVTAGFDWARDAAVILDAFDPFSNVVRSRNNRAVFLQYQGDLGRNDVQASVRHDDNEQFGGHSTGSLAWGIDLSHGLRVSASAGNAFKAPTFNELYFPFYGNPDLSPETSDSFDIGLGQRHDAWHWQLDAYQTRIDDLIVYDSTLFMANNLEQARIRGAELTAGTTLGGWDITGAASWLDPRNRSRTNDSENYDKLLPRRAQKTARLDVDRAFGDWRIGATVIGEGRRFDDVANTLEVAGFSTLDLRAEWRVADAWTLQARASNVFDHDYETSAYYAQAGREYGLTLRYSPD
ncbi:TonB-dependent vitamin B12 receptor [Lysobacter helvus]|uniref:TonB-dependent vitamin B12 receptor n=2 Tax=Lysobacteraceae TaxID=32033 RepID=A0ABN6FY77_9GAMM|nr:MULTISPECIES: TonB-dependent vitamin B12 receptor [Lysobacter]BCT92578.1 TonB-dependent vitamin B12 receptor [Lysobacter caseinilyticus]BCT95731.1 TonB-dependent vitamin B12 receptor [Lysobacter helvus]